jgi:Zn-dependent protease with chaperone function
MEADGMVPSPLTAIFMIWLIWALLVTLVMFFGGRMLSKNDCGMLAVVTSAGSVYISPKLPRLLDTVELAAVIAHEKGHIISRHTMKNYLVCVFVPFMLPFNKDRLLRQEHEADDYVAGIGGATALASALRKLSQHPSDIARAERLEQRYA